jgi:hypothetical protein
MPLVGQVYHSERATLIQGDCLEVLRDLPDASVDAVITDPPYPCIKRSYGTWTEAEWWEMMLALVPDVRRVLKPTGSAVFVLQPNSKKLGSMRSWLWEFMVWICREWNMIQDAWWWNHAAMPEAHAIQGRLMRPSLKACVWCGSPDCYRDQESVLWSEAQANAVIEKCARARGDGRCTSPSGHGVSKQTVRGAARRRGGVTPFNVFPTNHGQGASKSVAASYGHGAGTPITLCRWWVRYICPSGGIVLDPFSGSGTVGVAAIKEGRNYIGIEINPAYCAIARGRLAEAEGDKVCR